MKVTSDHLKLGWGWLVRYSHGLGVAMSHPLATMGVVHIYLQPPLAHLQFGWPNHLRFTFFFFLFFF
jgi:hypothetical protein